MKPRLLPQFATQFVVSVDEMIAMAKIQVAVLKKQKKFLCVSGCGELRVWKHENGETYASCDICTFHTTIAEIKKYWNEFDVPNYMIFGNRKFRCHWWQPRIFLNGVPDVYLCIKCGQQYTQVQPFNDGKDWLYEFPPFSGCIIEKPVEKKGDDPKQREAGKLYCQDRSGCNNLAEYWFELATRIVYRCGKHQGNIISEVYDSGRVTQDGQKLESMEQ